MHRRSGCTEIPTAATSTRLCRSVAHATGTHAGAFQPIMVNFPQNGCGKMRGPGRDAARAPNSQRARGGEHLLGMARDLYVAPNARDPAVGADQKRGAKNSHELLAIHRFF